MFLKTVLLISISAAIAYHLQSSPEDLRIYFKEVDTQVKALQHETMIQIRTNLIALSYYIDLARTGLYQNISSAAKPYWDEISALEANATQQGQDISQCVDLGNQQLYALNNSIATSANQAFNYYNQSGNEIIMSSATEAYSVIEELIALEQVVPLCNDDTCATDLKQVVTQYYQRAKATLIDAETKPRNYATVYLPVLLADKQLDFETYSANYTVFLNDIKTCINNL